MFTRFLATVVFLSPLAASADDWVSWLVAASSADEFAAIEAVDQKLAGLPSPHQDVIPARGFHSEYLTSSAAAAMVVIDLYQKHSIDTLVLMPAVDSRQMKDYGFPIRYRIESSVDRVDWTPIVIRDEPHPRPHGMPVVIPIGEVEARYIRIVPTELWQRAEGLWVFALSEFMAFDGNINHALSAKVESVSSITSNGPSYSWAPYRLVDGQTNLGLPIVESPLTAARGFRSQEFNEPKCDEWIQVDLGKSTDIATVRLIPATTLDPDLRSGGFPASYTIELSDDPQFGPSETTQMPSYVFPRKTPKIGLNPSTTVVAAWPKSTARYVRVHINLLGQTQQRMFLSSAEGNATTYLAALSEIEVFANEEDSPNVALGQPVSTSFKSAQPDDGEWSVSSLTDGHAAGGRLIATRDWIELLDKRIELQRERALLLERVDQSRDSISSLLLIGSLAIIGTLIVALASLAWRFQKSTQKRLTELRRQIARDLHDEVGSTLASIRLSAELGVGEPGRDPEICTEFQEIRDAATAAGDSMRDIVWLIDHKQSSSRQLVAHLRGLAHAMLRQIPYTIDDQQQVFQSKIPIEVRRSAVLALKEALNNVRVHSQATKLEITFTVQPRQFSFVVADNGVGIPPKTLRKLSPTANTRASAKIDQDLTDHAIPGSDSSLEIKKTKVRHGLSNLVKRAKDHGGRCEITARPGGGTNVYWSIRT